MNVFDAIGARRSIRAYQARDLEADKLDSILWAANQAPSAGNRQSYQIHLVRDSKIKQALARAAMEQSFVAAAPVVLVFCSVPARAAKYGERGEKLYAVQDATIAAAYAQLAITALGLGSCWVGAFSEEAVSKIVELPAGQRPVVVLPVGYAAENPPPTRRRSLAEVITQFPQS